MLSRTFRTSFFASFRRKTCYSSSPKSTIPSVMPYTTAGSDGMNKAFNEPVHLFVSGLGNKPLPLTRHSIGQYIIDSLAKRFEVNMSTDRGGWVGHKLVDLPHAAGPVKVTLFKSKQLMNISGPSIVQQYRSTGCSGKAKGATQKGGASSARNFIVLGDSISHPPKKLAVRLGGSANGHNGLKSIQGAMGGGNREFWQYRVGVGRGSTEAGSKIDKSVDAAKWVMAKMSQDELDWWGPQGGGLDIVISEIGRAAKQLEQLDG